MAVVKVFDTMQAIFVRRIVGYQLSYDNSEADGAGGGYVRDIIESNNP